LREKEGLLFIWEEEKAARDLYTSLYEKNNLSIFMNLRRSEQSHMDQPKAIIDKYGQAIPGKDEPGVFQNQTLQKIHDELLAEGLRSDIDGEGRYKGCIPGAAGWLQKTSALILRRPAGSWNTIRTQVP
jgi:hypothetical protein